MNDVEIKENCVVQFIDKDEIIETMQDCKYANPCNDFQRGVNACIDIQIVGIKHMPTADVAPRSEVEELSDKYEDLKLKYADLQKDHDELLAWGGHIKSAEIAEIGKAVAREIFGEIEYNFAEIRKIEYDNPPVGVMFNTLDYLKKKYMEEKNNV